MQLKPKILLVDDESLVLDSLREIVAREEKYQIDVAENGIIALNKALREQYCVIVTDLMLKDITGIDLLKSLKSQAPETQVIMMSGKGTIDFAVEAMKMGAFDFLTKPYSPPHLLQILDRARTYYESLMENKHLRGEIRRLQKNYDIIGTHPKIDRIREIINNIAPSDSTVLIQGKSGTGKELVARAIHNRSLRADGPFQAVNCGVFTETLIENELFGHEKGAYTGAVHRSIGRVEAAAGGTLFLDEIDTMSLSSQVKLLRVLEEHSLQRIGGSKSIYVDFRLIAATNVNLQEAVTRKMFRDDLYYRLNVITINLPELAERLSDIPLLISHLMERHKETSRVQSVSPSAMDLLLRYPWPGNVRELVNAVEYYMVMAKGAQIMPTDLPENIQRRSQELEHNNESMSLRETEKDLIMKTLRDCHGNKHLAAKILRIPRSTLYSKIQKHGIVLDKKMDIGVLTGEMDINQGCIAVQNQTCQ
ncbi:MAG TPA: sigma-54 dependent transcriptional regulator [Nitrospirota bacterium]|nr:sigma-54 dependent transcriptional regulator [Nitrospirota bacterium]